MTLGPKQLSRRRFLNTGAGLAVGGMVALASRPLAEASVAHAAAADERIKVGQIGTTHAHASGKIQALKKLSEHFELVGIVEPDPQKRKEAQDTPAYKDLKWLTEQQLLDTPGLKAVAVENTEFENVAAALRCIQAGMHVHLDKPPGESLAALKKLFDIAQKRGLNIQLGYMFRNSPAFQLCFDAVRKGWLGDIFEIHGVISKAVTDTRRKEDQRYAGGSMYILGCHLIDALIILMGPPDKVTPYIRRTRPEHDTMADNMLAVFEYPKATASVRSTFIEVDGAKRRHLVVCGSKGTIEIRPLEPPQLHLTLDQPVENFKKGAQLVSLPKMPGRYDDQLIDFAKIIRGQKNPDYSFAHELAVHKAVLLASGLPLG